MNSKKNIQKEIRLINEAKKDRKFFAPLYNLYFKQIYLFIFKKVQQESLAGDICSKTFMKAMMNIDKYEHKGFPFSSWLYRIACNEVNLHFREAKKQLTVTIYEKDAFELVDFITEEDKKVTIEEVLVALEDLPLEQSQLVDMRFFEQLSFKEIASIFDITEANAKMKIYRILEKIKKQLTPN